MQNVGRIFHKDAYIKIMASSLKYWIEDEVRYIIPTVITLIDIVIIGI